MAAGRRRRPMRSTCWRAPARRSWRTCATRPTRCRRRSAPALALAHIAAAMALNGEQQRAADLVRCRGQERPSAARLRLVGLRLQAARPGGGGVPDGGEQAAGPRPDAADRPRRRPAGRRTAGSAPRKQVWILLAAKETAGQATGLKLDVSDGVSVVQDKTFYMPAAMSMPSGKTFTNRGDGAGLCQGVGDGRSEARICRPADEGFTIARTIYTPDGTEADLSKVKQNDLMVVVLTGRATSGLDHQALITDLLPAGFETGDREPRQRAADRRLFLAAGTDHADLCRVSRRPVRRGVRRL